MQVLKTVLLTVLLLALAHQLVQYCTRGRMLRTLLIYYILFMSFYFSILYCLV